MSVASRGVALIGFMGAGKSTVGAILAPLVGLPLIDLDARVEHETGSSVASLFAERGEAATSTTSAPTSPPRSARAPACSPAEAARRFSPARWRP